MTNVSKPSMWQDWTLFTLRWALILGMAAAVLIFRTQPYTQQGLTPPISDFIGQMVVPLAVAAAANLVYAVFIFIPALRTVIKYSVLPTGWVIVGSLIYLTQGNTLLVVGITGAFMLAGMLRLGALWGAVDAVGKLAVTIGVLIWTLSASNPSAFDFGLFMSDYFLSVLLLVLLAVGAGVWLYMQEEHSKNQIEQVEAAVSAKAAQVEEMQNRARAISQMANTLSSTLSFDKVLDAVLNIGDSMRKSRDQRMVSMVLLFEATGESLYIATSRGLRSVDEHRSIRGQSGMVAQALTEAVPVIAKDPTKDPELNTFSSLAGIRSVLCIPLRAGYDSYGVLIYGTNIPDAFKDEHIDTLQAIGTQGTIALRNAQLYSNLMAEKDRIIQLEEDARKVLARDLHDAPAQTIASVKMRIEIIRKLMERDPARVPQELEEVRDLAQRANDEIRHVLSSLYPLALETQGLIGALNQTVMNMQNRYNQRVVIKLSPELETFFTKQQQGVIYSLINEAVENASKHAQAPLISVSSERQGDNIILHIIDNGKGFDVDLARRNERGRYGLENLHRRAESLDGVLSLESQVGRGTKITVVIPLRDVPLPNNRSDRSKTTPTRPSTPRVNNLDVMRSPRR